MLNFWRKKEDAAERKMTSAELMQVIDSGVSTTLAGVTITPQTAMTIVAVYGAVRIIAEGMAMLPLIVYRRLPNGGKVRAPEHPLYRILNGDEPNEWQSSYEFKENMTGAAALSGFCPSYINRDSSGVILELLPIEPSRVTPQQDEDFNVTYKVRGKGGREIVLPQQDIFCVKGFGIEGLRAFNPVVQHKDVFGLAKAAEKYGNAFFGNAARPSGHLRNPNNQSPEQLETIKKSVTQALSRENVAKTLVTDGGWEWNAISLTAEEAQFLETRKFQVTDVARAFRVPPHMLCDLEKATFSNIEQQGQDFVTYSLLPWAKRWEGRINKTLFSPEERGEYFAEFLFAGLLRGDSAARATYYKERYYMGSLNADEIREMENENPLPDGAGQTYYVPANMAPVNAKPAKEGPADEE